MINDLISIIESLDISLQQACYLTIIIFIISKPIVYLVKKFFKKGVI